MVFVLVGEMYRNDISVENVRYTYSLYGNEMNFFYDSVHSFSRSFYKTSRLRKCTRRYIFLKCTSNFKNFERYWKQKIVTTKLFIIKSEKRIQLNLLLFHR